MSVDLTGWVLLLGVKTLLGLDDQGALDPAYELEAGIVQGPRGETGIAHRCVPICWLPSADCVRIPEGAPVVSVSSLSRADQDTLARAVEQCRQVIGQMRAAQSGIVVAPDTALDAIRGKVH